MLSESQKNKLRELYQSILANTDEDDEHANGVIVGIQVTLDTLGIQIEGIDYK